MNEDKSLLNLNEKAKMEDAHEQVPAGAGKLVEQPDVVKSNGNTTKEKEEPLSLQEAIKEQAREDEQPMSTTFTLRKILGGDWLTTDFLRRKICVILLIVGFTIVYISNRYSCQKDMLEIDRLNNELTDAKYKALSSSSELTEKCRESNVLEMLQNNKDSVLKIPNQPPYIIYTP